jgi:Kelch motif/Zinc finger, C3HC4 type (RING finger)
MHDGGGLVVDQNERYLYAVFQHRTSTASVDELYQADLHQLDSAFWCAVNYFFSNFWQPLTVVADQGAAMAMVSDHELIFVGGYRTHVESGWFSTQKRQIASSTVMKFDLHRKIWLNNTPDLCEPRYGHRVLVVGDYLYVIGGKQQGGKKSLASVERLSLSRLDWEEVPAMQMARDSFGATVVQGGDSRTFIVVAGGCMNGNRIKSVEYLDCQNVYSGWKSLPNLATARSHVGLGVLDKHALAVMGGYSGFGIISCDTVEVLQFSHGEEVVPSISAYTGVADTTTTVPVAMPVPAVAIAAVPYATAVLEQPPPFNPGQIDPYASARPIFRVEDDSFTGAAAAIPQPTAPTMDNVMDTAVTSSDIDNACAVCLDRPKQIAFLCGHQACELCAPLFTECHTCRTPITGRIRLFG